MTSKVGLALAVLGAALLLTAPANASVTGTVILEGSDAIGFHCPIGNAGACTYRDQVWTALGGSA